MLDQLIKLKEEMASKRPAAWETLPDIELYKDQVLNYMQRQHAIQSEDDRLSGAMINNYIKSGLLPRANGKKYSRIHLVYLTAISSLKQVLSVNETGSLLKMQPDIWQTESFYQKFIEMLDKALDQSADSINENLTRDELAGTALQLALSSYAHKLACEKILDILKDNAGISSLKKV